MPENRDVAVLSITGADVVLSTVPSFAHHVVGAYAVEGNTGRPRREAALLGSKLDDSWIAIQQPRGFFLLLHLSRSERLSFVLVTCFEVGAEERRR